MSGQLVPLQAGSAPLIVIHRSILLVGRHPESDVRIDAPQISRRHCCLAVAYDRVLIRDLGSRHGVYVNGVRVEEAQLRSGDEVAIAHLIYRFEVAGPALASKPPSPPVREAEKIDEDLVPLDD